MWPVLGIIERALELVTISIKKIFPEAKETEDQRKQRAKENWDKMVEEEKKVREILYGSDSLKR